MMGKVFFRSFFDSHKAVSYKDGLYYQSDLPLNSGFEQEYTALRRLEGRLYDNDVVSKLPFINDKHPLSREWKIRKRSADRLIKYLVKKNPRTVLEVGCGNGWLTHYLHVHLPADCCGVDVNEAELKQAATLFGSRHKTLSYLYADINSEFLNDLSVDAIVLASVIQYFPDPVQLITRLEHLLSAGGQIHIIDSPFYNDAEVSMAKERSEQYFAHAGQAEMTSHYYHHSWNALNDFPFHSMYNPSNAWKKLLTKLKRDSPFPWIVIEKE
jgi:ubiquinone/menaquinone biosynthesis C-methylase UbiE